MDSVSGVREVFGEKFAVPAGYCWLVDRAKAVTWP